jgi:hypothetical protein
MMFDRQRRRFRLAVDRHPTLELARIHWDPGACSGRDEGPRPSVVVPTERSPLPENALEVGQRRRRFVGNDVGGEVSFYS